MEKRVFRVPGVRQKEQRLLKMVHQEKPDPLEVQRLQELIRAADPDKLSKGLRFERVTGRDEISIAGTPEQLAALDRVMKALRAEFDGRRRRSQPARR